ncbi:DMT family transporter [Sulfitobacter sp.]|uniref:DMT family transporter n=1 Tax=Sulfitobacter sp. TaxID=1903071 RepID=UPI00329804AD
MENFRGAVLMVIAMLGFAIEDSFIKLIGDAMPIGQILIMLGLGGAFVFAIIVRLQGHALVARSMLTAPVLVRGIGEMFGTVCFVSAIIYTPLSTASAILQAMPLVVTLGAALFLGEPVGWRRWGAVIVGFLGVLLIVRPGSDSFTPLSLLALGAVIGLATRDVATRKIPKTLSTMQLSYLGFLALLPAGTMLMVLTGTPAVTLDLRVSLLIIASIATAAFAYYAIVAAMRVGEISFVSPFRYTRLVFALIIGTVFFAERPDLLTLIGAAIIVASGVYTVLRERKLRLKRPLVPSKV